MRTDTKTAALILCAALIIMHALPVKGLEAVQENTEDFRVLPVEGELVVNVFLFDLDVGWFGARDLRDLLNLIQELEIIRPVAKARSWAFGGSDDAYLPFEFNVYLRLIVPPASIQQEFREALRASVSRTPYQISQQAVEFAVTYQMPLAWTDQAIQARDALYIFSALTEKYYPEVAGKYAIFLFCGIFAMGGDRPAIYYTFGQAPDSGEYLTDFGINIFGGTWWGRYFYIDLCSYPPPRFYEAIRPIYEIESETERLTYVAWLIDTIIDTQFVKSLIYKPRYDIQTLIDIVVIDATVAGVGYDVIASYFDPEMLTKSFRTLMPYNFFTIRLKQVSLREVPELRNALQFTQAGILLQPYIAYEILSRTGHIESTPPPNVDYIPAIILFTSTTSWVDSPGTLGIAIPNSLNPALPLAATGAIYYEALTEEGLTRTIMHEVGHTLGLRHPHDDFDEYRGETTGFFAMTYFTETVMSYSRSWIGALQRDAIFEGFYPFRTFWSIFDLDNIDRAMVMVMLQAYEENYEEILRQLRENGLDLEDVPEVKESLETAKMLAAAAVAEFRNHNYFDRFEFKGLGAQLVSALDYAFLASLLTGNIKNYYLPAVLYETQRLGAELASASQTLAQLQSEAASLRQSLEESQRTLAQKRSEDRALAGANEALEAEIRVAESKVAEVKSLREEVALKEAQIEDLTASAQSMQAEVDSTRLLTNLLTVILIVEVAAAGVFVFLRGPFTKRAKFSS